MGNIDSKEEEDSQLTQSHRSPSRPSRSDRVHRHRVQPHRRYTASKTADSAVKRLPLPKVEVDPFSILEIEPTLDEAVIKRAYKRLSLKHHPDKGGSEETFDLITKCYIALMNHIERTTYREADFQTLKHSATDTEHNTQGKRNRYLDQDRFDPKVFNEIFDGNRVSEPEDEGYGETMVRSDRLADDNSVKIQDRFRGNYSRDKFMLSFDDEKLNDEHKDVVIYEEPKPMISCNLPYQELGGGKVDDFGETSKTYQSYCDYKKALTSGAKLIDPSLVDRRNYNNVDHLKSERSQISYDLSDSEKKRLQAQKERAEIEEESRLRRLRKQDDQYEKMFNRVNDLMISQQ